MPVPLRPQKYFTVVRQIANHLDTDTYYVQAVVRNAYTDAVVALMQLEDKGGQRFKKDWRVPADPSGEGYYVSIVTSVYTDSGYTTKSENYGDEENTYFVEARSLFGRGGGGIVGVGGGIDGRTVRRIFQEEMEQFLDRLPEPPQPKVVTFPAMPTMRWDEVLTAVKGVAASINSLPQKHQDIAPVLAGLQNVERAIADKEVTPATDLGPVIEGLHSAIEEVRASHTASEGNMEARHTDSTEQLLAGIERILTSATFQIAPTTAKMDASAPKTPQQQEVEAPIDVTKLTT